MEVQRILKELFHPTLYDTIIEYNLPDVKDVKDMFSKCLNCIQYTKSCCNCKKFFLALELPNVSSPCSKCMKINHIRIMTKFVVPVILTKELSNFLNLPEGILVSRVIITKMTLKYINDNNLQSRTNRKVFVPNKEISKLFKLKSTDEINFYKLQYYLDCHCIY